MTAIGLGMLILGLANALLLVTLNDQGKDPKSWQTNLLGFLFCIGGCLTLAGLLTWIWKVMP